MKTKQALTQQSLQALFGNLHGESFSVTYSDGINVQYGDEEPLFTIIFHEDYHITDFLKGDLLTTFGEGYMEGRIDVEGDLADVISIVLRNGLLSATETGNRLAEDVKNFESKERSLHSEKKNIAHHYDLGNDFFQLWLDKSMTYSCAYFRNETDNLEDAQQQKITHSLRKLRLQNGESLLDIGCGWGELVRRACEDFNVKATGITLSEEQFELASELIKLRGLEDNAKISLMDYSTVGNEEKFDKIVSIGMLEHVGKQNLKEFSSNIERILKPKGLALLHSITSIKEGDVNRWIEKYIFPGGYIPTLSEIATHLSSQNLHIWDIENLAPHYRKTLDHWSERFETAVPLVLEKFDERFVRMWRLYLRASSACFREGEIEIHQILVSKGSDPNLPLTREDIYRKI
jgi:cyclopropane-fatty-acyl-phospholipid synthase